MPMVSPGCRARGLIMSRTPSCCGVDDLTVTQNAFAAKRGAGVGVDPVAVQYCKKGLLPLPVSTVRIP
jgi:hypothetical protein